MIEINDRDICECKVYHGNVREKARCEYDEWNVSDMRERVYSAMRNREEYV